MNYIGSIIGDYCSSKYNQNNINRFNPYNTLDIFNNGHFTKNTVYTMAVMSWLNNNNKDKKSLVDSIRQWCKFYQNYEFEPKDKRWIYSEGYNQTEVGPMAAIRTIPCAFYANTLDECMELSEISATATHFQKYDIDGAKSVSEAIYLARSGAGKQDIGEIISKDFGYNTNNSFSDIITDDNESYSLTQKCVQNAIACFINSDNMADSIRKAIWINDEPNIVSIITAGISEAYYGIPHCIMEDFKNKFDNEHMKKCIIDFNTLILNR